MPFEGQGFYIDTLADLKRYLSKYPKSKRDDVLKIWLERGYFTNLIYLEYMEWKAKNGK